MAEITGEAVPDARLRLKRNLPIGSEVLARRLGRSTSDGEGDRETENLDYEHGKAPKYILNRGFTIDTLKDWDIGQAEVWDRELEETRTAVVIPVHQDGTLRGLVRRIVNPGPAQQKYKNSYGMDKATTLLGLDHIPFGTESVVICEGPLDALWCYQWGFPAVAIMGSSMSEQQAQILKARFWEFVLAFDPDKAGRVGERKAARLLRPAKVRKTLLPEGHDLQDLPPNMLRSVIEESEIYLGI